jgi:hypothetical protein
MSNKYYDVASLEKKGYKFELAPNLPGTIISNNGNVAVFIKIVGPKNDELGHSTLAKEFGVCECHRPSDPKGLNRKLLVVVTESGSKYLFMDYGQEMLDTIRNSSAVEVDRKSAIALVVEDFVTTVM